MTYAAERPWHVPGLFVGLSLGAHASDTTALAVIEKRCPLAPAPEVYRPRDLFRDGQPVEPPRRQLPPQYQGRHLQRYPTGTTFPQIVAHVQALLRTPALRRAILVLDATVCGRPVVDLFVAAKLHPRPFTIVAGGRRQGGQLPKQDLIAGLQVLLQSGRLRFAEALPDVPALVRELLSYQPRPHLAATDTYTAREAPQDDLILAVALAVWIGEHTVADPEPEPVVVERYVG